MPKCRTRPYGDPLAAGLPTGRKLGADSMVVLLDSARSADPPQSSGITAAMALITSPDALRVDTDEPASKAGSADSKPFGRSWASSRSRSAAWSACADRHSANSASQTARSESTRCRRLARMRPSRSSGKAKCWSGSRPSTSLVARTSGSPSALPCALPVFCRFGDGQPMMLRTWMKVGRSFSASAASMAACTPATSIDPSPFMATLWVAHPYAR